MDSCFSLLRSRREPRSSERKFERATEWHERQVFQAISSLSSDTYEPALLPLFLLHLTLAAEEITGAHPQPLTSQRQPILQRLGHRDPSVQPGGGESVTKGEEDGGAEEEGWLLLKCGCSGQGERRRWRKGGYERDGGREGDGGRGEVRGGREGQQALEARDGRKELTPIPLLALIEPRLGHSASLRSETLKTWGMSAKPGIWWSRTIGEVSVRACVRSRKRLKEGASERETQDEPCSSPVQR